MASVAIQQASAPGFEAGQDQIIPSTQAGTEVPRQYRDLLEPAEILDPRSNEEILESLTKNVPVTSEKNVWAFWDTGLLSMPAWNKQNVVDWVRICGSSGWTIRIIDSVPSSPNYALNYLDPAILPDAYKNGTMEGPWKGAHSADFVRGATIWTHGGVSMDVGCILLRDLDRVCWNRITEAGSRYNIAAPYLWGQTVANYFVAARKGDPFIKRWHDLFVHLWTGHTSAQGLADDPLVSEAADTLTKIMQSASSVWEVSVPYKTLMEYMTQAVCWQRVAMLEDVGDGFSGVDYWLNHVYLFDAVKETIGGNVGFDQGKMFRYLTSRRDQPVSSLGSKEDQHDYNQAEALTWDLLTSSSMLKISRGPGLTVHKGCGTLLDEFEGKEPGSFIELLRFGSLHFRQTRDAVAEVKATRPEMTMRKKLTEP